MKRETQKTERTWQLTERAKNIGRGLSGVALTGVVALGVSHAASGERDAPVVPSHTETAQTGDTLWDMAGDVKNVDDRREVVNWSETNSPDLADGSLDVGDEVSLPDDAKDIG